MIRRWETKTAKERSNSKRDNDRGTNALRLNKGGDAGAHGLKGNKTTTKVLATLGNVGAHELKDDGNGD
jgi:hypothetical protein